MAQPQNDPRPKNRPNIFLMSTPRVPPQYAQRTTQSKKGIWVETRYTQRTKVVRLM